MRSARRSKNRPGDRPALAVVRGFIRAINNARVDRVAKLLTDTHRFLDSLGNEVRGGEAAAAAFAGYFQMVPDYRIDAAKMLVEGNTVIVLGTAGGSYVPVGHETALGKWQTPAAWRAVVREGRIAEWQVYADNEPIRALMRETKQAV